MKKSPLFFLLILAITLFTSCGPDEEHLANLKVMALDDIEAENYINLVIDEVDEITSFYIRDISYPNDLGRTLGVTNNPDGSVDIVINYFNFENPNGSSNHSKNGYINIKISGTNGTNSFKREVTFTNFSIEEKPISGKIILQTIDDDTYSAKLENFKITYPNQEFFTKNGQRTITQTGGIISDEIWDNIYSITGTVTGTNRNGISYTQNITSPLVRNIVYNYYVTGILELTYGEDIVFVNFGEGLQDNLVTITIDEVITSGVSLKP